MRKAFWKEKTLDELSDREWEKLCDGCGRCCLNKIEDDKGKIKMTYLACKLLDLKGCHCSDYPNRQKFVATCLSLRPMTKRLAKILPKSCAYRILFEGGELEEWHPLVSGTKESVHDYGISIRYRAIHETPALLKKMEKFVIKDILI